jgi:UV excision repair protein RAD23
LGAGNSGLDLAALQNNPQIAALRQQVAQNPELLQPLLQNVVQNNPAIAQLIAQNPEAMLQLFGLSADDMGEDEVPPGAQVVNVTPEEREAIGRVRSHLSHSIGTYTYRSS